MQLRGLRGGEERKKIRRELRCCPKSCAMTSLRRLPRNLGKQQARRALEAGGLAKIRKRNASHLCFKGQTKGSADNGTASGPEGSERACVNKDRGPWRPKWTLADQCTDHQSRCLPFLNVCWHRPRSLSHLFCSMRMRRSAETSRNAIPKPGRSGRGLERSEHSRSCCAAGCVSAIVEHVSSFIVVWRLYTSSIAGRRTHIDYGKHE